MDRTVNILDHGYLRLIETWGSDERIIESARMSTKKGFKGWGPLPCPHLSIQKNIDLYETELIWCKQCNGTNFIGGDEKLLAFLHKHKHSTPFEFAGMTIEVQAPIMVFREWHRHRTQSYSELSARYTPLPTMDYMPTVERCLTVNGKNKQANAVSGATPLTHEIAVDWLEELAALYEHAQRTYASGLEKGIPKELARLMVPVGRYSRMRATANLRNWLGFLTLRSTLKGPDAQYEIRMYADAVGELVKEAFPRTWELFVQ